MLNSSDQLKPSVKSIRSIRSVWLKTEQANKQNKQTIKRNKRTGKFMRWRCTNKQFAVTSLFSALYSCNSGALVNLHADLIYKTSSSPLHVNTGALEIGFCPFFRAPFLNYRLQTIVYAASTCGTKTKQQQKRMTTVGQGWWFGSGLKCLNSKKKVKRHTREVHLGCVHLHQFLGLW